MKRGVRLVAALCFGATLAGGCDTLLPHREDITSPEAGDRGRALVQRAVSAHGGRAAWDRLEDITFTALFEPAPAAKAGEVEPAQTEREIRFTFNFKHDRGRMDFPAEPGSAWVRNGDQVFFLQKGKLGDRPPDPESLRVPIEAQLFSMPFRMLDPGIDLAYAGLKPFDGHERATVLVNPPPRATGMHRRSLAYFDPETGNLVHVSFDVGQDDVGLAGDATYLEWQQIGDLTLPKRLHVVTGRPTKVQAYDLSFVDVNLKPRVNPKIFEKPLAP